jgi:predicted ferric reductase
MRSLLRTGLAVAYLTVVLVPLWLALGAEGSDGGRSGPAYDVSLATGLVALSLLVVTYVLPKRVRALSRSLGIDVVLGVHRLVGLSALTFVLVHVVTVLLADPDNLGLLDVSTAPNRARAAVGSTVALLLLIGTAVWRRRLLPRYETWRAVHVVLAVAVLLLAALHVWWLRHLVVQPRFRWWFAALAAVVVAVSLRRWVWRPLRAWQRPWVVDAVRRESPTVSTLVLRPVGHRGLRRFRPGQFAWIRIGSTPLGFEEHPFTIASAPRRSGAIEFTIKQLGDFSSAVATVRAGDRVWVDGPHGAFSPDHHKSRGLVLIAGGVGITPMISVLRALAQRGDEREHLLFVSARALDELLFREEITELADKLRLRVVELLNHPQEGWTGATGFLTADVLAAHLPAARERLDYFLCGSPPMVSAVTTALRSVGVAPHHIHTEKFDFV